MVQLQDQGFLRFAELRGRVGTIGDRMLSVRLKELEARGLVSRRVEPGPPVRVRYALTPSGSSFGVVASALCVWGKQLRPQPGKRRRPGAQSVLLR